MNELNQIIGQGDLTPGDTFAKTNELNINKEKYERFRARYLESIELEEVYAFNPSTAPKSKLIEHIEYTYVTFKSNQAPKKALSLFVKEGTSNKIMRRICCI